MNQPMFFFWKLLPSGTRRRGPLLAVGLIAFLAASSCAPTVSLTSAPSETSLVPTAAPVDSFPARPATLIPAETVTLQAVPTSRGPNLEATDPTTVVLASGQLQLVEFFRFT